MQLFIDSADVAELRAAAASGLIDGVTTNPTLIARSGRKMKEAIAEICSILEMKDNACKQAIFRAVRKLRGALQPLVNA